MHRSSRTRRRPSSRIGISASERICATSGYLIVGGALVDQDDERLRGISIMMCDLLDAHRLGGLVAQQFIEGVEDDLPRLLGTDLLPVVPLAHAAIVLLSH